MILELIARRFKVKNKIKSSDKLDSKLIINAVLKFKKPLKEILLLIKSIVNFCSGKDSAYAYGISEKMILDGSTHVDILNYSRRRTGYEFNYFLIILDNIFLIFLLDKLSMILSKLRKKPMVLIRSTVEPYLNNRLVSRLSLGNKNLVRDKKTQIYIPIFASAISLDSENPKQPPRRFNVSINKNDLHKKRIFKKKIDKNTLSGVIFSGASYPKRESIVDSLSRIMPVERLGKAYNKPFYEPKKNLSEKHLFCICPENFIRDGYCSEKAIEAYFSGYIPIYWNHPNNIKGILNPLSHINLYGLDELQIQKKIKKLIDNNELIKKMYEEPLFDKNFDIENLMQKFDLQLIEWLKTNT